MQELISIIVLTYNRKEILGKSVKSALSQTYPYFELLIIDDGSSDNTKEWVETLDDNRIQYFYYEHTGNVAALRNIGMRKAKGKYIAFLDSDDIWKTHKLDKQVRILEGNPNVGITFSGVKRWDSLGNTKENHFQNINSDLKPKNLFLDFINNDIIVIPSACLFRKSVLSQSGYSNENLITGDIEFISRILLIEFAVLDTSVLLEMTQNGDNMSNYIQKDSYHEYRYMLDHHYDNNKIPKSVYERMTIRMTYLLARRLLFEKDIKNAQSLLKQNVRMNVMHYKSWYFLFKSFVQGSKTENA